MGCQEALRNRRPRNVKFSTAQPRELEETTITAQKFFAGCVEAPRLEEIRTAGPLQAPKWSIVQSVFAQMVVTLASTEKRRRAGSVALPAACAHSSRLFLAWCKIVCVVRFLMIFLCLCRGFQFRFIVFVRCLSLVSFLLPRFSPDPFSGPSLIPVFAGSSLLQRLTSTEPLGLER